MVPSYARSDGQVATLMTEHARSRGREHRVNPLLLAATVTGPNPWTGIRWIEQAPHRSRATRATDAAAHNDPYASIQPLLQVRATILVRRYSHLCRRVP
jgi:hypothetical protein